MEININIVVVLVVIFVIAFAGKIKKNSNKEEENNGDNSEKAIEDEFIDYNDKFTQANRSEPVMPLVRTFSIEDKMMLRSMLDAEKIPTYVKGEHVNNMLPGIGVQGYSDSIIYVYSNDYEDAESIVHDYVQNLIDSIEPERESGFVDIVAVVNTAPTKYNQYIPEIIKKK